jgi:hypoxia up-regulated 1
MDGIDFKLEVSRETLEKLCKDLFARSAKPIETVLKSSNITLDKVKSLVLFGGGARIPAVQKWLSALVGDAKIARNVDGDEAAVLGAVLHAASLSPQYKLGQTFNIKDLAPRAIYVSYSQEKSGFFSNI